MYKLAIDDSVEVPVKFTLKAKGVAKLFGFTLTCDRLTQDEIAARLADKENQVKDFMLDVTTGWSGQRLVLDDAGEPAAFNAEAMTAMLNAPGVAMVFFNAYIKDCGAKEKN